MYLHSHNCVSAIKTPLLLDTTLRTKLVYQENHRPAASLTNFVRNGVSSNKGVLIADTFVFTCAQLCISKKTLFKKQLFDLEVKGQGPTKVIMVCDTLPYGHAPTYQISLTYLKTKMLWSRQENTI